VLLVKNFLKLAGLISATLFLVSCGNKDAESQHEAASHQEHGHEHSEEVHTTATADDGLVLNDGQKWEMDTHTRSIFVKMASCFETADLAALDAAGLKQAGSELMVNIRELIQGCTMTGPAHDQLHVYLMGYIPAVEALEKEGLAEDAKKVQHYLAIYGDYFE